MRLSPVKWLAVILVTAVVYAAWNLARPYEWKPDPAAGFRIDGAGIERDHDNFWLNLHLKANAGSTHDWQKPIRLILADGRELEAADTRLAGNSSQPVSDLWLKFWLENNDLKGPLRLKINDGSLSVDANSGRPRLGWSTVRHFNSNHW